MVAGLALTACSSSTPEGPVQSSISFSTDPPSVTSTAATESSTAAASAVQTAGTLTGSDDSGNAARLVISLGSIQPANQITDPVLQACADDLGKLGSNFDRTEAVPITIQIQLTSALSSNLIVNLAEQYLAVHGGSPEGASTEDAFLLAEGYASGPKCNQADAVEGWIHWTNASPGVPYVWHGYILEANTMTPNDPTGSASPIHRLLLDPLVSLSAGSLADMTFETASSPFEVLCRYPMGGGGGRPLLATDPSRVLSYGCSPA
jgi:hypothetical protein